MNSLAQRLKYARELANLSQQEVAKRAKISQPTYFKIENGSTLKPRNILEIAHALNVNVDWLATGEGEMNALTSNINPALEQIDDWDSLTPLESDEVEITFYKDFAFACGHGSSLEAMENEKRKLRISKATINRIGSSKDMIFATLADGDSMSPTINDGATIWIDTSKQEIKDGRIFVFEYGGLFMCKRLYRLPNNGLKVVSDNEIDYPTFTITGEQREQDGFRLIGWVWHWSVMERW